MAYEDNGRLFMKVFLLDGSVNGNEWGVRPDSIAKNITSAIGKPLVLFKNALGQFDHPSLNDKNLDHALAYQDLFRVGTYIDVFESPTQKGKWYGIAEVTDENFKRAVKEDPSIPFYVSPTIRMLREGQDDRDITDWSFMHSAIVDRPAFGIHTAYIGGNCHGDQQTCLLQLRKASIEKHGGKVDCGFCTYKAAKQIQKNVVTYLSANSDPTIIKTVSSHEPTHVSNNSEVSNLSTQQQTKSLHNNVVKDSSTTAQPENQADEIRVKVAPGDPGSGGEERGNIVNDASKSNNNNKELLEQVEKLTARNKELELRLTTASADKDSLQTIVGKLNDEVTKLKDAAEAEAKQKRYNTIAELVNGSALCRGLTTEERQGQIETFNTSSFTEEQIAGMLGKFDNNFKKASLAASGVPNYSSRLQLGNNKTVSDATKLETKSGSTQTHHNRTEDDEVPYYLRLSQQMFRSKATAGGGGGGGVA